MDFPHEQYAFHIDPQQHHQQHHVAHQPAPYQHYHAIPQHVEAFYTSSYSTDYPDFGCVPPEHEDVDGCSEILTRPRLTKEQVEVLETQFQAHPKPNGHVKRQLALQTKLALPRVANWFQNRRAKDKQMRKQEEFEISQSVGIGEAWNNEHQIPTGYTIPLQINTAAAAAAAAAAARSLPPISPAGKSHTSATSTSAEELSGRDAAQEASWTSLQRPLNVANSSRGHYHQDEDQSFTSLLYRDNPHPLAQSLPLDQGHLSNTSLQDWSSNVQSSGPWNMSSKHAEEREFEFGFGAHPLEHQSTFHHIGQARPESRGAVQGYADVPDIWTSTVATPTNDPSAPGRDMALHESDSLPLPQFPSRRGSSSDELSTTLDQFALAGTPPPQSPITTTESEQFGKPKHQIDIAARRKRPRPAALGTTALRSSSYAGPSPLSPTFRFGRPPQNPHSIRQVKSMGQNLNVKYGGIRKPSSAQRSPLNIATFAEAEDFNQLMAARSFSLQQESEHVFAPLTPLSNEDIMRSQMATVDEPIISEQRHETPSHHFPNGQPSQFSMASPPSTPLKSESYGPPQMQSMMPPISAPPQHAAFLDYTPPYSAGPLTTSSWPDAPLTSPETAAFPVAAPMPQQSFISPVSHEYSLGLSFRSHFIPQPPAERKQRTETTPPPHGQKPTEFFIQEFPRQKEEHAHVAQQMAQTKPKNYVFANATPSDF